MRAIQVTRFGGPEVLVEADLPKPVAELGQVVVDVWVAPVLFLDTQIRSGSARDWFPAQPPYVPGAGVAGVVAAVGEAVDAGWMGRRVAADTPEHGGYQEQVAVPAESLIEVPEGLGMADAAALLHDGRTAVGLFEAVTPRAWEWVLILGAGGGLGALLVQLAHGAGARVAGAASTKQKRDLAVELGADGVVDYTESGWGEQVLTLTGGVGPHIVFDGVGGKIGREAFEVTAPGGRFSAHGAPSGGFAPINGRKAQERQITVSGIEEVQFSPTEGKRLAKQAFSKAAAGQITPIIGQTYPLERAVDAHQAIESRRVVGKTLLEVRA
jgi:NADPH2:quinone reductase